MPAAGKYNTIPYGDSQVLKVKGTSSYTTGGYDLPANIIADQSSPTDVPVALNDGGTVIGLVAAGKVKFITSATGAEVANASDQSAVTVSVLTP